MRSSLPATPGFSARPKRRAEAGLEIRSLVKTKTPKVEFHRYPARTEAHFARLFAVIREYLDALDRGRFNYRPGFGCCDVRLPAAMPGMDGLDPRDAVSLVPMPRMGLGVGGGRCGGHDLRVLARPIIPAREDVPPDFFRYGGRAEPKPLPNKPGAN